jgi:MFS family permease
VNARLRPLLPFLAVFTQGIGGSIVIATLPSLGREVGLREIAIGGIISWSSLVVFFTARMWGRLSDRVGRKPVILIGLWGYTIGTLSVAFLFGLGMHGVLTVSALYISILVARLFQASMMSSIPPASAAYIADTTTATTRTVGMGRLSAATNTGQIIGPAIAGLLAAIHLLVPMVFAAAMAVAAAVVLRRHMQDSVVTQHAAESAQHLSLFDRRLRAYLLLGVTLFTGFAIVQQTLSFRIQDTLQLNAREAARNFGFTMILSASFMLLAQTLLVQRMKLVPMMLLRIGMPLVLIAFTALIWCASMPAFCIAMSVLGFGMGMCGPGFTAASSLAVSAREQGSVAGMTSAVPALGWIVGPVGGTGLYGIDPVYPYVLAALILAPACVAVFRVRQHMHVE